MRPKQVLRTFGTLACVTALGACATDSNRAWVRQGPGNYEQESVAEGVKPADSAGEAPDTGGKDAQSTESSAASAQATQTAAAPAPQPETQSAPEAQRVEGAAAAVSNPANALGSGYTQAARYGDLLFLSGQIPSGADTPNGLPVGIAEQTDDVMRTISQILADHGLTMANVIQVTVYLSSINDLPAMNSAYQAHFRGALPARTVVDVEGLPRGALVEISVVAGR